MKGGVRMSENSKIKAMLEKYNDFFGKLSHVDVAETAKGRWFFLEYDIKYNRYHSFCEFRSADELKLLMANIIADDVNTLLESGLSVANQSLENVELSPDFGSKDYSDCLPRLVENVKILHESQKMYGDLLSRVTKAIESVLSAE